MSNTKTLLEFHRTANNRKLSFAERDKALQALEAYLQNWAGQPGIWSTSFAHRGRHYYL